MFSYLKMCQISGEGRRRRQHRFIERGCLQASGGGIRAGLMTTGAGGQSLVEELEHPARVAALSELHARPAPRVEPSGHVTRLVYALDEGRTRSTPRRIDLICA